MKGLSSGVLTSVELVEARERGLEFRLVKELGAADQVAFEYQKCDFPPLGVEAVLRRPVGAVGDDPAKVAQSMHRLDVDVEVRRELPSGVQVRRQITGNECQGPSVVDVDPVRRRRRQFVSVDRGVRLRDR